MGYLRREDINRISETLFSTIYRTDLTDEFKEELIQFALDEEGDNASRKLAKN